MLGGHRDPLERGCSLWPPDPPLPQPALKDLLAVFISRPELEEGAGEGELPDRIDGPEAWAGGGDQLDS